MAKYVKLSEKATMFFDPSLKLKVLPGKVVKLPTNYTKSRFTMDRIRNGHLQYASEVEAAEAGVTESAAEVTTDATVKAFSDMTAAELRALILKEYEYTEVELKGMKKQELIDILEAEEEVED